MSEAIGQAYVQIVPSAEGISEKITNLLEPGSKSAGHSSGASFGSQFASFATKAVAALGVGTAISKSVTSGMNFETSFAKASTLFSGTSDELANLQSRIMDISSATGVAASELAEAAYSAESASVPVGNLGDMIEASSKLATAGFTDIDTALSATAKTMNAYGMMSDDMAQTQENMERVQRILIQTQNRGITTVGELGASLAQVTPTAASFGVSFEQVGAALAGMTAQGTPTAQATTQLNALIAELGKSGTTAANNLEKAAEGTEYAGMSFAEMMASGADLNDVMGLMQAEADKAGLSMVDMFSSIEAGKAAMAIENSDWTGNMDAMATEADVVGEAYGTMADTVSQKVEILKTGFQNIGIEAFSTVADTLVSALEGIQEVFTNIKPSLEGVGTAFMNLFGIVGSFIAQLFGFDESMSASEAASGVLSTALDGIATAVNTVSGPLQTFFDGVITVFNDLQPAIDTLKSAFDTLFSALGDQFDAMTTGLGGMTDGFSLTETAASVLETVINGISTVIGFLAEHLDVIIPILAGVAAGFAAMQFISAVTGIISGVAAAFTLLTGPVGLVVAAIAAVVAIGVLLYQNWDTIKAKAGELKDAMAEKFNAIKDKITGVVNGIKDKVTEMKDAFMEKFNAVKDVVSGAFDSIKNTASNVMNAAKNTVQEKLDNIKNAYEENGGGIKGIVSAGMETVKGYYTSGYTFIDNLTGGKLSAVADTVRDKMDSAKQAVSDKLTAIKDGFSDKLSTAMTTVSDKFTSIKDSVQDKMSSAKTAVSDKLTSIKTAISDKLGGALSTVRDKFDSIKNSIRDKLASARDTVQSLIDSIKSKFNFSWSLPTLKLPHINITGEWSLNPPSWPSFSVSWYSKAMDTPFLFRDATIFGAGETGDEIMYGRQNLLEDIREASRAGGAVINNYFTISGAEDPEDYANRLARQLRLQMRMV